MAERGEVAGRRAYMVSINDREMQVMRCSLVKKEECFDGLESAAGG